MVLAEMIIDSCSSFPSSSIFQELQRIHDTGFFSPVHSLEDKFQQVRVERGSSNKKSSSSLHSNISKFRFASEPRFRFVQNKSLITVFYV